MYFGSQPRWQQVTALVSLSAGGAIAGFSFVPRTAADLASPTAVPIHLLALQHSARPAPADDQLLRSAIVNVAHYYLRMARSQTPAEIAAIIWQNDSVDGVDHGESCAAFASLTLELAAQAVGQQSWVTGGTSYPWPLHKWADARVDQNPASPGVISIRQDAEDHGRWHPLSDGYQPQPGDWVLFHNHVEVVTKYAHGVLHTVGGDSLPNFSVNAHEYREPLDYQGVVGFVNNGTVSGTASQPPHGSEHGSGGHRVSGGHRGSAGHQAQEVAATGLAAIPGAPAVGSAEPAPARRPGKAAIPAMPVPGAGPGQDGRPEPRPSRPGHEPAGQAQHGPGHPGSGHQCLRPPWFWPRWSRPRRFWPRWFRTRWFRTRWCRTRWCRTTVGLDTAVPDTAVPARPGREPSRGMATPERPLRPRRKRWARPPSPDRRPRRPARRPARRDRRPGRTAGTIRGQPRPLRPARARRR